MTNKELKILRRSQFKGISFRLGRVVRFTMKPSKGWFGSSSSVMPPSTTGKKKGISFDFTQKLYKGG